MSRYKKVENLGGLLLEHLPAPPRSQRGVMAAHFALTMNYAAMTVVLPLHAAVVWGATADQGSRGFGGGLSIYILL